MRKYLLIYFLAMRKYLAMITQLLSDGRTKKPILSDSKCQLLTIIFIINQDAGNITIQQKMYKGGKRDLNL